MDKILTASFLRQVKIKVDMLKAICDSNAVLHTHRYTYAQGRDAPNILIKEVRVNKGN